MISIIVDKSDNTVLSQGNNQVPDSTKNNELYYYYDDVDDSYIIGGTYDGTTYTESGE